LNEELLNLLKRKEWLLRDRLERATAANKKAYTEKAVVIPFTEEELVDMELRLLDAQIALECELE
jgi:hypothetical protein